MPEVRLRDDGPRRFNSRTIPYVLDRGDTVTVDAEVAARLVERDYIEYVDDEPKANSESDPATCDTVKSDGEVCGRELPCSYHSDDNED